MSVDFPAPLGPIIPTRLIGTIVNHIFELNTHAYLDKESAQLTSTRLGLSLPG